MNDLFQEERLRLGDLETNHARRLPICICVDASYSMKEGDRIGIVNQGIRTLIDESAADLYAQDTVDLCILSFVNNDTRVEQPFSGVKGIRFKPITARMGNTPLARAVQSSLDQIEERLDSYESTGISRFRPWLILMSDGVSDDSRADLLAAAARLKAVQQRTGLKVKCIGMMDSNVSGAAQDLIKNDLAHFSADGTVESMDALRIGEFFSVLSRSAAGMSTCIPGQDDTDLFF